MFKKCGKQENCNNSGKISKFMGLLLGIALIDAAYFSYKVSARKARKKDLKGHFYTKSNVCCIE